MIAGVRVTGDGRSAREKRNSPKAQAKRSIPKAQAKHGAGGRSVGTVGSSKTVPSKGHSGKAVHLTVVSSKSNGGTPVAEAVKPVPAAPRTKDEAYARYAPLVKYVVDRIAYNVPRYVEREDLVNAAVLGLFDALEKFDASKGTKFETYAVWRIKGAVLDELRAMDWASRSIRRRARQMESAQRVLGQKLGREATGEELAKEMEMTSGQLSRVMDEVKGVTLLSLDHTVGNEDESSGQGLAEHIVDPRAPDLLADLETQEMNGLVVDVINRLSDQERLVIALYYYEEMTLKEIGETLRISESRVSQIHTRAISRIRGKMGKLVQFA